MAVEPLRRAFGLARITVATYQAVSGAGIAAMEELREQTRGVLAGEAARPGVFREPCAFNLFSHDSEVDPETGANGEEQKIIDEARKITGDAGLRVTATCVRVPVARAHSQAIVVEVERACREEDVRGAYEGFAGVRVLDDRARNSFPTPLKATGRDEVLVGRIRPDPAAPKDERGRTRGWCLFASGDQLRKGAALNAVQIAELAGVRLRGSQAAA